MTTVTYTPAGNRVIAIVHHADDTTRVITLPRAYDTPDRALMACVMLTVNDQQVARARAAELTRLGEQVNQ